MFLTGSPINYADCLIGSPITWHDTAVQEFDGASRQNPGPAGAGAVLFAETGEQVRPPSPSPPALRPHGAAAGAAFRLLCTAVTGVALSGTAAM